MVIRKHLNLFPVVLFLTLSAIACGTSSNGDSARYYEFTRQGDRVDYTFIAKTSDPDVIRAVEKELTKPFGERRLFIIGEIERGDGGFNGDWSWHFVPGEWHMAEAAIEVCDGRADMVEENLDYWVDRVGQFCPWSSRVLREVNDRWEPDDNYKLHTVTSR